MVSDEVEELLAAIRKLTPEQRRELLARVQREGEQRGPGDPLGFIGFLADEPELADAICEDAMLTRESGQLRLPKS